MYGGKEVTPMNFAGLVSLIFQAHEIASHRADGSFDALMSTARHTGCLNLSW